ncbi:carbamoyltransferase N-terminal domain-containing protein [Flavitalea sp. BT771]|uniref:carbamoyltransferase N-terminal domain-containing protein n=1 Tax=Flavitalea sp. BT771 TaxID=3063329 RepID=UPI0026E20C0A|nr:carbamoyltransferase N-terminal domain-containing protein [Flavitalea sp. BT771]MDO6435465.1 carbamoyltransferase N-terminal domain-containing protein [Flavitalea sp. BT771]MDV6224365.1 carbamoyltransferase N-terminal domain-containing protein [Flavitalea sp. BT771]
MTILGIKLTHDAAIALIENGRLIFSYEMEKLNNSPRYSPFNITIDQVESILSEYGHSLKAIDKIVIDGWSIWELDNFSKSTNIEASIIKFNFLGKEVDITTKKVADYGHYVTSEENIMEPCHFSFYDQGLVYSSYLHVAGHVAAAYCTSPFAKKGEDAMVLVWDGGMPPQLFYFSYNENAVRNLGSLFPLLGNIYTNFSHAFKPFSEMPNSLSIAGKAMAYMALGKVNAQILQQYHKIFSDLTQGFDETELSKEIINTVTNQFITAAKQFSRENKFPDTDMLTTFQEFLQELLLEHLSAQWKRQPELTSNLCLVGGCALNIKWNNSIRNSPLIKHVWVPPFPNDAGNALGAACCEMLRSEGIRSLEWDVYSGPGLNESGLTDDATEGRNDFVCCDCRIEELAEILHKYNEPVVFLNGRAELGPRALGNRSILSPAHSSGMKKRLNEIKGREQYRPVAPICLEEYAPEVFSPGSPDPFMLFEHFVRKSWKEKVPAICHLDGSARLQTINNNENPVIYRLLRKYFEKSGIPLLCNTSANLNGSGFFPDVRSAMEWNKANLIWSDNKLYVKSTFVHFTDILQ